MKNNQTILVITAAILTGSVIGCSMFGGTNSNFANNSNSNISVPTNANTAPAARNEDLPMLSAPKLVEMVMTDTAGLNARLKDKEIIVLGEFRYGIALSKRRWSYDAWLESHLTQFDILSVTEDTAVAYAALRVHLKRWGLPIPANDAWIAALALQHQLPVLSRDQHFDVVPGLDRRSW